MRYRRVSSLLALGVAIAASAPVATATAERAAGVSCAAFAAPAGNDANSGSQALPFKTLARLVGALSPGQTGCLEGGATFVESVTIKARGTDTAPITITSSSGKRPVIEGVTAFDQSSSFVWFYNVRFVGSSLAADIQAQNPTVSIGGFGNAIIRSGVSGPAIMTGARACIALAHAHHIVIDGNQIHECAGVATSTTPYASGIYAGLAVSDVVIANNFIYQNSGDAISLKPNSDNVRIARNLFFKNDSGVYLGGDVRFASSNNAISQNIFLGWVRYGVHADFAGRAPSGNTVSDNCFWNPSDASGGKASIVAGTGFNAQGNRTTDPGVEVKTAPGGQPQFLFRSGAPCLGIRPQGFNDDPYVARLLGLPEPGQTDKPTPKPTATTTTVKSTPRPTTTTTHRPAPKPTTTTVPAPKPKPATTTSVPAVKALPDIDANVKTGTDTLQRWFAIGVVVGSTTGEPFPPGTRLTIRCDACPGTRKSAELGIVRGGGADIAFVDKAIRIRPGALIEIVLHRPGWVGRVARRRVDPTYVAKRDIIHLPNLCLPPGQLVSPLACARVLG